MNNYEFCFWIDRNKMWFNDYKWQIFFTGGYQTHIFSPKVSIAINDIIRWLVFALDLQWCKVELA